MAGTRSRPRRTKTAGCRKPAVQTSHPCAARGVSASGRSLQRKRLSIVIQVTTGFALTQQCKHSTPRSSCHWRRTHVNRRDQANGSVGTEFSGSVPERIRYRLGGNPFPPNLSCSTVPERIRHRVAQVVGGWGKEAVRGASLGTDFGP